jgi:pyrimidine deaminase RibD-like protein
MFFRKVHLDYMRIALSEAEKCTPVPTAFCVGCVLVHHLPDSSPTIIATGYSRELPGNTHAEANALYKAKHLSLEQLSELLPGFPNISLDEVMSHTDVYTTLEPCSVRLSGLSPCVDALITAKVKRCYIGVGEPLDFVKCEGAQKFRDVGIEVVWLNELQEDCLAVARRGHN